MEIIKTQISDQILKIDIGTEQDGEGHIVGEIELDIENQHHFVETINHILDESTVHIILDMGNVTYIDSSGLWAIYEGHKKASQINCKMLLLNPTKDVRRVLDITTMSSKLGIFETLDAAVESLNK